MGDLAQEGEVRELDVGGIRGVAGSGGTGRCVEVDADEGMPGVLRDSDGLNRRDVEGDQRAVDGQQHRLGVAIHAQYPTVSYTPPRHLRGSGVQGFRGSGVQGFRSYWCSWGL